MGRGARQIQPRALAEYDHQQQISVPLSQLAAFCTTESFTRAIDCQSCVKSDSHEEIPERRRSVIGSLTASRAWLVRAMALSVIYQLDIIAVSTAVSPWVR